MSIRTSDTDTDVWFRSGMNGASFGNFTYIFKNRIRTSRANRCVLQLKAPNGTKQFGIYTRGDGKTVRLSDADQSSYASADSTVTLDQDVWRKITVRGYTTGGVVYISLQVDNETPIVVNANFYAGELVEFMHGNDYYVTLDCEVCDVVSTNFPMTDQQVAAAHASPQPWTLFTSAQLLVFGSCRGVSYEQALASLQMGGGAQVWSFGFSNHQGVLGDADYTYGPTAHGAADLPIAYKSSWPAGGSTTPTTVAATVIPAGDSREVNRLMPNATFAVVAGANTDGKYSVDIDGNTAALAATAGANGAIHTQTGITHPDGGWALQKTNLNGKPRFYHRIGPGLPGLKSMIGSLGAASEIEPGVAFAFAFMLRFPLSFFQLQPSGVDGAILLELLQQDTTAGAWAGLGPLVVLGDSSLVSVYTRTGSGGQFGAPTLVYSFTPSKDVDHWISILGKANASSAAYLKIGRADDDGPVSEVLSSTANWGAADASPTRMQIREGLRLPSWTTFGDNKLDRYGAGHVLWHDTGGSPTMNHQNMIDTLRYQTLVS